MEIASTNGISPDRKHEAGFRRITETPTTAHTSVDLTAGAVVEVARSILARRAQVCAPVESRAGAL